MFEHLARRVFRGAVAAGSRVFFRSGGEEADDPRVTGPLWALSLSGPFGCP